VALTIIWSQEALDDIESIATYIEKDSIHYAKSVVSSIFSKVDILLDFPLIGRVVPEYGNDNIRELFVYSYRLIYKINKDMVSIVAVIHGKRIIEPSA
jgi:addiction module RelE/StbE family toxin